MSNAKVVMSQAANTWAGPTYIEDVFSTYLYTGNSSTQTITNGIDLAGEGGLVWIKKRGGIQNHCLQDTEQGITKYAPTNATSAFNTSSTRVTSTSASGFSISNDSEVNENTFTYASWTFRKAPRFFDVVTYTGTGSAQAIAHNLGVEPGCIIIKRTDGITNWQVYHRGLNGGVNPEQYGIQLNLTNAQGGDFWSDTAPTSTEFTVSGSAQVGGSGLSYVAYLFAHDPLGPSGDGSDGLIACGSYTGINSTTTSEINIGWEPQFVIVKCSGSTGNWFMADTMRGMWQTSDGTPRANIMYANFSNAESELQTISTTSTGFKVKGGGLTDAQPYIYIAIRRGPMREPTSGTEVFAVDTTATAASGSTPSYVGGFPVDMGLYRRRSTTASWDIGTRLLQGRGLNPASTGAEYTDSEQQFDYMIGWKEQASALSDQTGWMFRRAPGFFDVVCYTGNGVAGRTVSHNLGVAPEMMIVKNRSQGIGAPNWTVYHSGLNVNGDSQPQTDGIYLNTTGSAFDFNGFWNDSAPTDAVFTLGSYFYVNTSGDNYIAYLFATLPGISKVGSYTGNGSNQTINCGFTGGARFVLIKRTDSTGDWYVWDTARGIVAGNDPHLSLNTTAAEVTTNDSIDPDSSGFIVNQLAATNINVSSATYIYLAIA